MARLAALLALALALPATAETVVFLPGLGDGKGSFASIVRRLPEGLDVHSEVMPNALPGDSDGRSPETAARDLHDRLVASGKTAPYVVVGHSLGGPEALAFAQAFPDETAGVVLVDPRLPGFTTRCKAAGLSGCSIPKVIRGIMPRGQIALLDGVDQLPDAVVWARDLPDVPVVLLSAGRPPVSAGKEFAALWQQLHAEFAAALPQGKLISLRSSRHYIHQEKPALVLDELLRLTRSND
jgi:pimeloyl-ACP methyl ester carboxylesterase